MSEDLKLSLDRKKRRENRHSNVIPLLLILVLIVAIANLLFMVGFGGENGNRQAGLSAEKLQEMALKLEKQKLPRAAVRAWLSYLDVARPSDSERAQVWYRIGKNYQDDGDYERALEAYYRSESIVRLTGIETEISKRTALCLEKLGKFAALRYELEERTSIAGSDSTNGGEVIAEIGNMKITNAGLDAVIEDEIEVQLSQVAGGLTPEEKRIQKERMLEEIMKRGGRGAILERFIAEEILYRRAIEEKLHEEPGYNLLARNIERKILAQRLIDRRCSLGINIGPDDLRRHYEAHLGDYKEDGRQKSFDEVRDQVYAAVRAEKEMEIQGKVIEELKNKYDVVIHRSKL